MQITRRDILKLGLLSAGMAWWKMERAAIAQTTSSANLKLSPQIERFTQSFYNPPILKPVRSDNGTDYYELVMEKNEVQILPSKIYPKTKVWRYCDPKQEQIGIIGPTIRIAGGKCEEGTGGRNSVVRFINKLGNDDEDRPIKTVVHLHGKASPPQYDGYAEDFIPPDYYKDYHYNNHRAAIFWYHDHAHEKTARNVYMGLAGIYIVEEAEELGLNLPKDSYDLPLILQDKKFDRNAQLVFDPKEERNIYGDVILVNGVPWPRLKVARRKYRFRLLNASASRQYKLSLSQKLDSLTPDEEIIIIGSDGGLLDKPFPLNTSKEPLPLGVAERYDLIIDFSKYEPNTEVFLRNTGFSGIIDSDTRTHAIMCFEVDQEENDDSEIPPVLCTGSDILTAAELSNFAQIPQRTFRFDRNNNIWDTDKPKWKINNKFWVPKQERIDADPKAGALEIWTLVNPGGGWVHPVHIHLIDVRIYKRNGRDPRPYEAGRKDVIQVGKFEKVQIVARFNKPDLDGRQEFLEGKYMFHCHNLVHEDRSMMTVFEVGTNGLDPITTAPAKPIAQMTSLTRV